VGRNTALISGPFFSEISSSIECRFQEKSTWHIPWMLVAPPSCVPSIDPSCVLATHNTDWNTQSPKVLSTRQIILCFLVASACSCLLLAALWLLLAALAAVAAPSCVPSIDLSCVLATHNTDCNNQSPKVLSRRQFILCFLFPVWLVSLSLMAYFPFPYISLSLMAYFPCPKYRAYSKHFLCVIDT
jgi:hypothetical protein